MRTGSREIARAPCPRRRRRSPPAPATIRRGHSVRIWSRTGRHRASRTTWPGGLPLRVIARLEEIHCARHQPAQGPEDQGKYRRDGGGVEPAPRQIAGGALLAVDAHGLRDLCCDRLRKKLALHAFDAARRRPGRRARASRRRRSRFPRPLPAPATGQPKNRGRRRACRSAPQSPLRASRPDTSKFPRPGTAPGRRRSPARRAPDPPHFADGAVAAGPACANAVVTAPPKSSASAMTPSTRPGAPRRRSGPNPSSNLPMALPQARPGGRRGKVRRKRPRRGPAR